MITTILRSNPRGWFIVLVLFFALSFSFSGRMSLPVLMPGWEVEFGWSRTLMTVGAAVIMIIMGSVAPFAGHLLDRFGPRYLVSFGMALSGIAVSVTAFMGTDALPLTATCTAGMVCDWLPRSSRIFFSMIRSSLRFRLNAVARSTPQRAQ